MSDDLLTRDELDRLLHQLIRQTLPASPSDAEAIGLVRWAEGVRIGQDLLAMVLNGEATARMGANGEPTFRITPAGILRAEAILRRSPQAREYIDMLAAGGRLVKGPDGAQ